MHTLAQLDRFLDHLARGLVLLLQDTDDGGLVAKDLVLEAQAFFGLVAERLVGDVVVDAQFEEGLGGSRLLDLLEVDLAESEVDVNLALAVLLLSLEEEGEVLELGGGAEFGG